MALEIKRILLCGLMLLLNACVYYPQPFYHSGYGGGSYYNGGHGNYHENHYSGNGGHRHDGDGYHERSYH